MPLVRLLTARVQFGSAGFVTQQPNQIIQVDDREAEAMIADHQATLVEVEILGLPAKGAAFPGTVGTPPILPAPVLLIEPPAAETVVSAPPAIQVAKTVASPTGAALDVLGLNDKILDALEAAGIATIDQLLDVEDLTTITGIGRVTAERIVASLKKWADGSSTEGDG